MLLNVDFIKNVTLPYAFECFNINDATDWVTPIMEFIETGNEP